MTVFPRSNPASEFYRGFSYPFQAGRFLLQNPGLLKYILVPFLINLAVFSGALYLGLHFFNDFVIHRLPQGDAWYWIFLYYFLWILAALVTAVGVFFSFSVVGNFLASPFNDLLSQRTEEKLAGKRDRGSFSLKIFWHESLQTYKEEGKRMLFFLGGMVLLLFLNLIPWVGTLLYAITSFIFTLFFLDAEFTGFFFSRRHWTFHQQRRYILARKSLMSGFGTAILAILAIPFLQFFCIPVAVVGATSLCLENPEGNWAEQEAEIPGDVSSGQDDQTFHRNGGT
jgi:CysZ protein